MNSSLYRFVFFQFTHNLPNLFFFFFFCYTTCVIFLSFSNLHVLAQSQFLDEYIVFVLKYKILCSRCCLCYLIDIFHSNFMDDFFFSNILFFSQYRLLLFRDKWPHSFVVAYYKAYYFSCNFTLFHVLLSQCTFQFGTQTKTTIQVQVVYFIGEPKRIKKLNREGNKVFIFKQVITMGNWNLIFL